MFKKEKEKKAYEITSDLLSVLTYIEKNNN